MTLRVKERFHTLAAAAACALLGADAHAALAPRAAGPAQPVEDPGEAAASVEPAQEADVVVRVERIALVGLEQVDDGQVLRILRDEGISEGTRLQLPRDERIERVKSRLRATGYFRFVNLRIRGGTRADDVVLVVDVEERVSVSVTQFHAASSKMTPFSAGLSAVERNFLGKGVHLGGGFAWGTLPRIEKARRQQAYRAYAEAPRIANAPVGVLGSVYFISASEPYRVGGRRGDPEPNNFRTFDYTRVGGVVGVTFPVLAGFDIGVDYRFERLDALMPSDPVYLRDDGTTEPVALDVRDGIHRHTVAHFALSYDGRQRSNRDGKGGRIALDLQLSSAALGSNYEYIKLVAGGAYTFRLPWKHWITPIVSGGQIAGAAPRFEQFYSGDLSEFSPGRVQGLRYSTRNPFDLLDTGIDHRPFGVLFGRVDLEYVWPLFRRTKSRAIYGGDLFFSVGVFTLVGDKDGRKAARAEGDSRVPVGLNANAGLRLDTPLGTLDLSVGNLMRRLPL